MNVHELRNFLALAECLNFRQAGKVCGLSPSAMTRSIQRLEEEAGGVLFMRDNRSVALTEAGAIFKTYASEAVREWEGVCETIRRMHGENGVRGRVTLYASVTAVYSLLPELLEKYRALYPEVKLDLKTGAAEESVELVLAGDVDVAVAALPDGEHPGLEFMPLAKTDLVFVSAREIKALPMVRGRLDLSEAPLVLPKSGLSRQRLDRWLREKRVKPNVQAEVSGNEGILSMVRLGSGVGVVPELVLEKSPFRDEVKKITKAPKLEPYTVGLCAAKKSLARPAVAALWSLTEE
ncbi:MAG: HTH-type transcriptional activator IlvY [Akkermansiaceae bacterium]